MVAGVGSWFSEARGKVLLEVRVDEVVRQILEKLDLTIWPFVKVDRFDFRYVDTKLSVNA